MSENDEFIRPMTGNRAIFEMKYSAKRNTIIFLGLAMMITMIIAASLPQLELQPGMPLPGLERSDAVTTPTEEMPLAAISTSVLFKAILVLILAVLILYVIFKLIKGIHWGEPGFFIRPFLIIALIIGSLLFLLSLLPKSQNSIPMELHFANAASPGTSPLGAVPGPLLWLVGIVLLIGSILICVWIFSSSHGQAKTINLVGLEAEIARQELTNGLDLKDVIVKCYRQMSLVLEKEKGLGRKDFMTTGEFENLLEAAGIPHDPIHQLTQLFEAVRYGEWHPNPKDEQVAIHCLEAIIIYSRKGKGTN